MKRVQELLLRKHASLIFLCFSGLLLQLSSSNSACAPLGRVHRAEKMNDGTYASFRESIASKSAPLHGEPNRLSAAALRDRVANARLLSFCEPMRLHRLGSSLFQRIQKEVSEIMRTSSGASVLSEKHPIAWVKAFGEAKSFSLITASGSLNDTSDLLNFDTRRKRFSQADKYPALADFIELFPHTTNWRINALGPSDSCDADAKGTGFSPHRAFVLHEVADETGNAKSAFRMKFHLPVLAETDLVDMHQHDQSYEFELGDVYYFTNGCRHAVENRASVPRVHIIWDMLLTEDTFERMLGEGADLSEDVVRMRTTTDRAVKSKGKWTTTDVEQEPEKTWATMQVFFKDLIDATPPKECRIAMEDAYLMHAPVDVVQKEALVRGCKADFALVSRRHQEKNESSCSPLGRVHRSEKMNDGTYSSFREAAPSVAAPVQGEPNRLSAAALKDRVANARLLSFCEPMRLHRLSSGLFERIQAEVSQIMTTSSGASVLSEKHPIAWVKAFGEAKSFSLITASGSLNDTSDLLNFDTRQKRFSQADKYPALADFIELFPHTTNWRINVLGPSDSCDAKGTGFSPHRAFVLHEVSDEAGNAKTAFRMKFHLPVLAQTELVDMHQHDQSYEFELGDVYYFTNGCRHAVENRAPVPRVHIIWDMLLTEDTFERMLGEGADLSDDLARMRNTTDRTVKSKGTWTTTDVEQEPEKTWATMQVFFKDLIDASPPKECRIAIGDAHLLHSSENVSQTEALERGCTAEWALVSRWSQEKNKVEGTLQSNSTSKTCAAACLKDSSHDECLSKGHCALQ